MTLFQELLVRVVAAVLIGFVMGWSLRQIVFGNRLKEVSSMWRGRRPMQWVPRSGYWLAPQTCRRWCWSVPIFRLIERR